MRREGTRLFGNGTLLDYQISVCIPLFYLLIFYIENRLGKRKWLMVKSKSSAYKQQGL